MTPRRNRTSLTRNRWQEIRIQWVASLPSLIHCLKRPPAAGTLVVAPVPVT